MKVLDIIISHYDKKVCKICGEKILFFEELDFDNNAGMRCYHKYNFDKDNE